MVAGSLLFTSKIVWIQLGCLHPVYAYPSCLQTTVASVLSQESSHTVPHWSLMHTSTLPSYWLEPPTRRTSPYVQFPLAFTAGVALLKFKIYIHIFQYMYIPWHLTPASSEWPLKQLTIELCEQSVRLASLPVQPTPPRYIGPAPAPKWALWKATASVLAISALSNSVYVNFLC